MLTEKWNQPLSSRVLTLFGGVTHSFDLVSADGRVVGDAKWYKDLQPIPAAKLSVIAEYVWLLSHVPNASRKILGLWSRSGCSSQVAQEVRPAPRRN